MFAGFLSCCLPLGQCEMMFIHDVTPQFCSCMNLALCAITFGQCHNVFHPRLLQNEVTGIDLQVPLYQEIRGTMMTGHVEYQIIVVTRLAAFKSAKHKPEDIVQLVVGSHR